MTWPVRLRLKDPHDPFAVSIALLPKNDKGH